MSRPKNPDKKQQLSIRICPDLKQQVFDVVDSSTSYKSVSELVGIALTTYLSSPDHKRIERSA